MRSGTEKTMSLSFEHLTSTEKLMVVSKRLGLRQGDLARRVGMSRARLSQLLNVERLAVAPRPFSATEKRRIARALGTDTEEIFGRGQQEA